jgi:alkanesulfonate monooxygenase SsuD/methylene tetrahydromethanopterin reductase-like flavin-dependent oxidoreductase (luciferase family)
MQFQGAEIGYTLSCEEFGPRALTAQAVRAERAGFDFAGISDHYHPWVDKQGNGPFVWGVLGATPATTTSMSTRSVPTRTASSISTSARCSRPCGVDSQISPNFGDGFRFLRRSQG